MSLNINKYVTKKHRIFRLINIYLKRYLHCNHIKHLKSNNKTVSSIDKQIKIQENKYIKILFNIIYKIYKFIIRALIWSVPLVISLYYYNEYESKFNYIWVLLLYIIWTYIRFEGRKTYKYWQNRSKQNAFYNEFCNQYNPIAFHTFLFLAVFVPINIVPLWIYFLIFIICIIYDLYERRYLTLEIQQNQILKNLETLINNKD